MNKYKCEYFSKVTGEKEVAMMADKFDFISLIDDNNVDLKKEVKIFEKDGDWKLAHHIVDGKTVYKNYAVDKKKEAEQHARALQQQKNLNDVMNFMTGEICPSRLENQTMLDIVFDGLFCGEDVSKPKLKVIGTE